MTLRIHGGEAGGRRLRAPRGIRPSQGVVKEAIFNMLGARLVGADVLDLYAGSGALGIEALSRGARTATFVDRDRASCAAIRANLEALGYGVKATVVAQDAGRYVERSAVALARFGAVFLDPPYGDPGLAPMLERLDTAAGAGAAVVVEHHRRWRAPLLTRLVVARERSYGASSVTILEAA